MSKHKEYSDKRRAGDALTLRKIAVWMVQTRDYTPLDGALENGDLSDRFKKAANNLFSDHYSADAPYMIQRAAGANPELAAHMLKHMVEYRASARGGHHIADLADRILRNVCREYHLPNEVRAPA